MNQSITKNNVSVYEAPFHSLFKWLFEMWIAEELKNAEKMDVIKLFYDLLPVDMVFFKLGGPD